MKPAAPDEDKDPFAGLPVGQLPPCPWLSWPETRAVMRALTAKGTSVRFVGGCVRDGLLQRPVTDIDIATPDSPEVVTALLEEAGLRAIPTGIAHGTVTALAGERHFEITTLRKDIETFGRRARVEYTDDWLEDAKRRDFTFNAMSATMDGAVYDPFEGLADLSAGRVRFVGRAVDRIDEDVLRILRFFRFLAYYGRSGPDGEALLACRARAPRLTELSGERVQAEMMKLLAAPDPASVLLAMQGEQVLAHLLPEMRDFGALRQLTFIETRGLVHPLIRPDTLRRLAATLNGGANDAFHAAERLRLSGRAEDRLVRLAGAEERPEPSWDGTKARRLLHAIGTETFVDLVLLAWARSRALGELRSDTQGWKALLDEALAWSPRSLPVDGQDVLALGVAAGPEVGAILTELESWWVAQDFQPARGDALDRLRMLVSART